MKKILFFLLAFSILNLFTALPQSFADSPPVTTTLYQADCNPSTDDTCVNEKIVPHTTANEAPSLNIRYEKIEVKKSDGSSFTIDKNDPYYYAYDDSEANHACTVGVGGNGIGSYSKACFKDLCSSWCDVNTKNFQPENITKYNPDDPKDTPPAELGAEPTVLSITSSSSKTLTFYIPIKSANYKVGNILQFIIWKGSNNPTAAGNLIASGSFSIQPAQQSGKSPGIDVKPRKDAKPGSDWVYQVGSAITVNTDNTGSVNYTIGLYKDTDSDGNAVVPAENVATIYNGPLKADSFNLTDDKGRYSITKNGSSDTSFLLTPSSNFPSGVSLRLCIYQDVSNSSTVCNNGSDNGQGTGTSHEFIVTNSNPDDLKSPTGTKGASGKIQPWQTNPESIGSFSLPCITPSPTPTIAPTPSPASVSTKKGDPTPDGHINSSDVTVSPAYLNLRKNDLTIQFTPDISRYYYIIVTNGAQSLLTSDAGGGVPVTKQDYDQNGVPTTVVIEPGRYPNAYRVLCTGHQLCSATIPHSDYDLNIGLINKPTIPFTVNIVDNTDIINIISAGMTNVMNPRFTPATPTIAPYQPCPQIATAIGPIDTDPFKFINELFGILLSLTGGVALSIIIYNGYRLMTSQGKPESIKKAQEGITAGIIGIIFAILSIAILTVIGVNILHLPGFS